MPSWTLGELTSNATRRVGRRADILPSVASFWVNVAYHDVIEASPRHALLECLAVSSSVSGENRIDLPSDFREMINLSWLTGSSRTFRRVSESEVDREGFLPIAKSDKFVLFRDWIELHPSPDSAYSIQLRYHSWGTDMLAVTDVPSVSTPWRKGILRRAEQYLHEYLGNDEKALNAEFKYQQFISQIDNDLARRQQDQSRLGVHVIYDTG